MKRLSSTGCVFPGAALRCALLLGALLLGACEPSSPSAGKETASSETTEETIDTASSAGTSSTGKRATQRADRLAERLIARTDSAFASVEPLSAREKRRLRRYLQDEHLARARRLGIAPVRDRRAAADVMSESAGEGAEEGAEQSGVVRLRTNDLYIIDPRMGYAVPLLVPSAAHLLTRIGRRFQRSLLVQGLPPYRFILTNVLRTGRDQTHLRGTNVNAAQGKSTHQYGTSFDIFYGRFHYAAVHDSLARSAPRPVSLDEVHLQRRLRRAYRRFGETHAEKIKAVLGRTLLEMQSEGLLLAIYERRQSVYHLTVAREVAAPPAGEAPGGSASGSEAMTAEMRRLYANVESQLSDIDNDLNELGEQAQSKGEAQQGLADTLAALRNERDRLKQDMSKLVGASASEFEDVEPGLRQRVAEVQSNVERARINAMQRRSELQRHLRTQTQEMDRKISQLERRVENADGDATAAFRQRVSDLRAQLDALQSRRKELRGASGQEFRTLRSDAADAVARLKTDLQTASAGMNEGLGQGKG